MTPGRKIEEEYPYHIAFDAPAQSRPAESTRTVADTDEDRCAVGSYRLVSCNGIHPAAVSRPAFAAVDG